MVWLDSTSHTKLLYMKTIHVQLLVLLNLLLTGFLLYNTYTQHKNAFPIEFSDKILKVRGIIITDSLGVERVIIGAPLPDPTFHGYRASRGQNAGVSGVMLYDSEGQERGGYVTDDDYGNVFLTLDSKTSQQALFISEPQGGATMMVWGANGNKATMGAYNDTISLDLLNNGKKLNLSFHE